MVHNCWDIPYHVFSKCRQNFLLNCCNYPCANNDHLRTIYIYVLFQKQHDGYREQNLCLFLINQIDHCNLDKKIRLLRCMNNYEPYDKWVGLILKILDFQNLLWNLDILEKITVCKTGFRFWLFWNVLIKKIWALFFHLY